MAATMIPILMKILTIVLVEIQRRTEPEVVLPKPKPVNFLPREHGRPYSSPDHKVEHAFHLLMKPTSTFNTQFLCLSRKPTPTPTPMNLSSPPSSPETDAGAFNHFDYV